MSANIDFFLADAYGEAAPQGAERVRTMGNQVVRAEAFAAAREWVGRLGDELELTEDERLAGLAWLDELAGEASKPHPDVVIGASILLVIRDEFAWAYPLAEEAVAVSWPAVLVLMAA